MKRLWEGGRCRQKAALIPAPAVGYLAGAVGSGGPLGAEAGARAGPGAGSAPSLVLLSLPAFSPPHPQRTGKNGAWVPILVLQMGPQAGLEWAQAWTPGSLGCLHCLSSPPRLCACLSPPPSSLDPPACTYLSTLHLRAHLLLCPPLTSPTRSPPVTTLSLFTVYIGPLCHPCPCQVLLHPGAPLCSHPRSPLCYSPCSSPPLCVFRIILISTPTSSSTPHTHLCLHYHHPIHPPSMPSHQH